MAQRHQITFWIGKQDARDFAKACRKLGIRQSTVFQRGVRRTIKRANGTAK